METVQKLVKQPSFDARGVYVPAGHIGVFDTARLTGKEKHLEDVGDFVPAVVQIAPIAPTGPNPTAPQQIPPGAVQTAAGTYAEPGKVLVGAPTAPAEERLAVVENGGDEAKVSRQLSDMLDGGGRGATSGNADDDLVAGTVAEITATLGTKTDDELTAMRAAERDREKPRTGVIDAIAKELEGRKSGD